MQSYHALFETFFSAHFHNRINILKPGKDEGKIS